MHLCWKISPKLLSETPLVITDMASIKYINPAHQNLVFRIDLHVNY